MDSWLRVGLLVLGACATPVHASGLSDVGPPPRQAVDAGDDDAPARALLGPGFPVEGGAWLSFYGTSAQMGDLARVAATYRVINIDADPGTGNFTDAELATLRAGGANRVLSYLNVGSCEHFRTYWAKAPPPFVPCARARQLGPYEGYHDEVWMDLADSDYQTLLLEHVAARIAARGVDGLFLDNLELVEHGERTGNGPCGARCRRGGLELVRRLRERFPEMLLVMQNATGEVTREGLAGDVAFPLLLDGIAHEEVYAPDYDPTAEAELLAWQALALRTRSGRPLWIGVEDYVGSCRAKDKASAAFARARAHGFATAATDASSGQKVVCFWD